MDKSNYLELMISADGGMREEVAHRVVDGRSVWLLAFIVRRSKNWILGR